MKPDDLIIAALIAVGVFAFVVKRARAEQVRDPAYVPTGFTYDIQLGGYTKVGQDGMTYVHYV